MRHTKAPWQVVPPDANHPSAAMVAGHCGQVTIYHAPLTEETRANAALIAAAPELLEIAEEAHQVLDELCMALAKRGIFIESLLPKSRKGFGSRLLTVITKATGKDAK